MRPPRFLLAVVLFLSLAALMLRRWPAVSSAQESDVSAAPCCPQDETAPRQLQFPYYSLRDGFNSTLLLVSASPKPLDFVVAIRSRSGQTALAPALTIQPQEKLSLDLGTLLAQVGADATGDFSEGSVAIYFEGTIMPLAGQLTLTNPARGLSLESEMVDNSPGLGLLPPVLNAVWWGLGGGREASVMVSNTSGEAVTADVFLDFLGVRHAAPLLVFRPHETKLLSVTQLLGELEVSPSQAPEGGITIVPRGPKPALVAQGKVTDPGRGFSTTLNFLDPSVQWASALHASGVPIGTPTKDSPYAALGTFLPHVVVRNLLDSAQSVTLTIEYPGAEKTEMITLAPVSLAPYETKDISLDAAFGLLPLPLPYCSIRIEYSGPPGSVLGEVSSIEEKGDLVIDSRLANEGDGWAGSGANPWHLDDETESILFLTNMSDQECPIGFQVQAGGVSYYLTDLKLAPRETRAIDLRQLRDAQAADFQGNKIPATATDGAVHWIRLDNLPVMGRVVVLKRHQRLASSYACGSCPCPPNLQGTMISNPSTWSMLPTQTKQFTCTAEYRSCNGLPSYYNVTSSANWTSSATAVATVNNTTPKGLVTGVGGGIAPIRSAYDGYGWYFNSYTRACVSYATCGNGDSGANVCDFQIAGTANPTCDGITLTTTVYQASQIPSVCTVVPSGSTLTFVGRGSVYPDHHTQDFTTVPTLTAVYDSGPGPGWVVPQFTLKFAGIAQAKYHERDDPVCQ